MAVHTSQWPCRPSRKNTSKCNKLTRFRRHTSIPRTWPSHIVKFGRHPLKMNRMASFGKELPVAVHGLASQIPYLQLPLALPDVHGNLMTERKWTRSRLSIHLSGMFGKPWLITCSCLWNLMFMSVAWITPRSQKVFSTVLNPITTPSPGMTTPWWVGMKSPPQLEFPTSPTFTTWSQTTKSSFLNKPSYLQSQDCKLLCVQSYNITDTVAEKAAKLAE